MPDNTLILVILKSIELGTLKFDSAITILHSHGISLQINREHCNISNNSNNNNANNGNNDNESAVIIDTIHNGSTPPSVSTSPCVQIHASDDSSESNNNNNNTFSLKFGDFSTRGNQIWNQNYAKEKEKFLNGSTDELLKKYKDFTGNNQLKSLPKEIINFRRANEHFEKIFLPQLVCFYYFFLLLFIFLSFFVCVTFSFRY